MTLWSECGCLVRNDALLACDASSKGGLGPTEERYHANLEINLNDDGGEDAETKMTLMHDYAT